MQAATLSAQQRRDFDDHGYVVLDDGGDNDRRNGPSRQYAQNFERRSLG